MKFNLLVIVYFIVINVQTSKLEDHLLFYISDYTWLPPRANSFHTKHFATGYGPSVLSGIGSEKQKAKELVRNIIIIITYK